jgi:hypothetical protein
MFDVFIVFWVIFKFITNRSTEGCPDDMTLVHETGGMKIIYKDIEKVKFYSTSLKSIFSSRKYHFYTLLSQMLFTPLLTLT